MTSTTNSSDCSTHVIQEHHHDLKTKTAKMKKQITISMTNRQELKLQLLYNLYPWLRQEPLKKINSMSLTEIEHLDEIRQHRKTHKQGQHTKEYHVANDIYKLENGGSLFTSRVAHGHIKIRLSRLNEKYGTDKKFICKKEGVGYRFSLSLDTL